MTFENLRKIFGWASIKAQPIRGVVAVALFIALGSLVLQVSITCVETVTKPLNLPNPSSHWQIVQSDIDAKILWETSTDLPSSQYGYYPNANQHIASSHGKVFYLWLGDSISGFPCSRYDKSFLTVDGHTGELINQYEGRETRILRSIIPSNAGFAIVSDTLLSQFDENGNLQWQNPSFVSRSTKNIFETEQYYYLPLQDLSKVIEKKTGENLPDIHGAIIAVYEDIMLVSGEGNEIQIWERNNQAVLDAFNFPKSTDGFGFKPFVARYENKLILTQLYHGVKAYDLDQQTITWSLELPFLQNEYPVIFGDKLIAYDGSRQSLEFYYIQSGKFVGRIELQNTSSDIVPEYIDIVTDQNTIIIYFQNTHEIVAIETSA